MLQCYNTIKSRGWKSEEENEEERVKNWKYWKNSSVHVLSVFRFVYFFGIFSFFCFSGVGNVSFYFKFIWLHNVVLKKFNDVTNKFQTLDYSSWFFMRFSSKFFSILLALFHYFPIFCCELTAIVQFRLHESLL